MSLIVLATSVSSNSAAPQPPAGTDPDSPTAKFYQSLARPTGGGSCCGVSDCRPADYRLGPSGYEVRWREQWVTIPDQVVIHGKANPTGRAIWCRKKYSWKPEPDTYCFLPASEG